MLIVMKYPCVGNVFTFSGINGRIDLIPRDCSYPQLKSEGYLGQPGYLESSEEVENDC